MADIKIADTIDLTNMMRDAFVPFALYTIRNRALVQYEDGLKPVQRRILWAMNRLGLKSKGDFRKVANIVGETTGNFHPHGDASVSPALTRMAQPWNFRVPLILGKGNFGSMDRDNPAAARYIEAKLSPAAEMMLEDTIEDICEFRPNYDQRLIEPMYLGSKFPNALINGTYGIAVGIACVSPHHNPAEICDAIELYIKNPDATVDDLLKIMPGPDWFTGCIVFANNGIRDYYETGKGSFVVQAKAVIETVGSSSQIVITELPSLSSGTNVGMSEFIESIVELVEGGKSSILADGIEDIEDRSEREEGGNVYKPHIIIKVKPKANAQVVLNELYEQTRLRINFNVNQNILFDNNPKQTSMIELIKSHIKHRRFIIKGRVQVALTKAERRLKMVAACLAALDQIDKVLDIVKSSQNIDVAKESLKSLLGIDDEQAEYILDIQIRQFTRMQTSKLKDEEKELNLSIKDYRDVLDKPSRIDSIIIKELADVKAACDCKRYTTIVTGEPKEFTSDDLIEEQKLSILINHDGYANIVKRVTDALTSNETERIAKVLDCSNLDYLMAITKDGYAYVRPLHTMEISTRRNHGSNILNVGNDKSIVDYLIIPQGAKSHYVSILTSNSRIKTSAIEEFDLRNSREQEAIKLSDGAHVVAAISHKQENNQFVIMSADGFATRYACDNINPSGRKTQGVAGFSATGGAPVALMVAKDDFAGHIFFITENGMGKKVPIDQIRISSGRTSKGSNIGQTDKKTGRIIGAVLTDKAEDVSVVTTVGQVIFYNSDKIPERSRYTRCETISSLVMGDKIQKVFKLW